MTSKDAHRIGTIGGDKASLLIKSTGGRYFWAMGLKDEAAQWEEIPRRLFQVLATFEAGRDDD